MKKLIFISGCIGLVIVMLFILRGGFDVQNNYYDSFADVKGGWLPIDANLLPKAKKIHLRNNIDTNEYFFKVWFSEDEIKDLLSLLLKSTEDIREVDCLRERICERLGIDGKIMLYEIKKDLENGHKESFWMVSEDEKVLYISNRQPVSDYLLIK